MEISSILASLITGILALIGVIFTSIQSNKKIEQQLSTGQEVTKVEIRQLEEAIEKHNKPIERVPVIEEKVITLENRVDKLEGRVNSLDRRKP